jgi:hypothetical protein
MALVILFLVGFLLTCWASGFQRAFWLTFVGGGCTYLAYIFLT